MISRASKSGANYKDVMEKGKRGSMGNGELTEGRDG